MVLWSGMDRRFHSHKAKEGVGWLTWSTQIYHVIKTSCASDLSCFCHQYIADNGFKQTFKTPGYSSVLSKIKWMLYIN